MCPWKISCQRCAFRSWSLPLRAHNALLQRNQSKQREPGGGETSMLLARDHSGQAALHWVADPSLVASAPFEEQVMPREMRFDLTLWPAWLGARAGPGAKALKPSCEQFRGTPEEPFAPRKFYVQCSKAYTRLSPLDHQAAFNDAELAVSLATKRAKRELIAESQLRRAVTLFSLERYGDSNRPFIGELWFPKLAARKTGLCSGWCSYGRSHSSPRRRSC